MKNVQLYTKRTTIYESVQLYIVYLYKAYLYTKSTIIQSLHEMNFVVSQFLFFVFNLRAKRNTIKVRLRGWGRCLSSFPEIAYFSGGCFNTCGSSSTAKMKVN